jgi:non-ribosomal peptide synthase protein (TIGR01720 family)
MNSNTAYNTEINDLLISALGMSIKKWAGIENVIINLEGHGREELFEDLDVNRTIGWFTAEYPVLIDMARAKDISFTIKSIKETLRRIPNRGIGYGVLKFLSLQEKDFRSCSKPEISFNYLGDFDENPDGKKFDFSKISSGKDVSPELEREYALDINCMVIDGQLSVKIEFNKNQFVSSTIEKFLSEYIKSLKEVIAHCAQKEGTEITPDDVGYTDISLEEFEDLVDEISDMVGDI